MATLIQTIDSARNLINEPLDSSRSFPDNTSSFWTDSVLTDYYNLISEEVFRELVDLDEAYFTTNTFLSIISGQAEYTLPSDLYKIKRVEDNRTTNTLEIPQIKLSEKGRAVVDLIAVQRNRDAFANAHYILGNRIIFDITPNFTNDSAIRIHYAKRVERINSATSTNTIPPEFNNVVVWGIVKYALLQQQSEDTTSIREYERLLREMRKQGERRSIQRPRRVGEFKEEFF